ncbi:helix-turn-helix domain-containing protein [Mycobacterium sp. OTB74]|jgi:DNA-binding HxlR family transcriptional regulator|uniref:winged helix-turn-helix transcriptional regulator n=1 Tax=Mycobacterium sp. OTB74 TaxID=1853452 RepID=UPI0024751630|nr:helix-turn-helix domain-containing protein [Mycobacterium sp. OTB74]MDH6247177.1 DNA-binding HxlR family transcriptional regulator [Mycobacterium sp. OTB74]
MKFEEKLSDRQQWSIGEACSVAKLLDLLSTKTVFLAVRESLFGTTRFEDFIERIGTSAPAVSRALKQLEAAQLLVRVPYQEPGKRARDEYRLTAAGEDLLPVYLAMSQWGDKHLQNGQGPLTFVDRESGNKVNVVVTADDEAQPVDLEDIEIRVNRGFGRVPSR